jgi:ubiquinone/menaquinone biosynthesis C-methylase UbiE
MTKTNKTVDQNPSKKFLREVQGGGFSKKSPPDRRRQVEQHFDREYRQFDSFYEEKKGFLPKVIDKIFRRSMQLRYKKVIEEVAPYRDATIFDVGCGTGRYSIALALKGIKKALGIDFAQNMIDEANHLAVQYEVDHIGRFVKANFMQMNIEETFDHVFAMGVFDYIENPVPFLKKMIQCANKKVMISLPLSGGIIQKLRKFKFEKIKKCPIFFYSQEDVRRIAQEAGVKAFTIEKISKDYFLSISVATEGVVSPT